MSKMTQVAIADVAQDHELLAQWKFGAGLEAMLRCAFGYYDDDGGPHACDKPAPYIWGASKTGVASLCKEHLLEQYRAYA